LSRPSLIAGVAVVWLGAVLAAQPGMRASHAFTILGSAVPWVVSAGDQVSVPLTLRNDGLETWDPALGFHLSYHWLSFDGGMVDRDGARTDFPFAVRPGQSIEIEARLLAPDEAGLHRLQWDMVQEHVAWFSIRDPRDPVLHLVLVLPATNAGFSLFPSAAALALALGAFVYARRRSWQVSPLILVLVGLSDVIWAILSLWSKQWRLLAEADMAPGVTHAWIALATAAIGPLALVWVSRRVRPWLMWGLVALGTFVVLADLLYFRYFSDILSTPALLAARQTGQIGGDIRELLEFSDLWLAFDLIVAIPLLVALRRMPEATTARRSMQRVVAATLVLALVPGAVLAVRAARANRPRFNQVFRNMYLVQDIGLYGYHAYDFGRFLRSSTLRSELTADERHDIERWFDERAPLRSGEGRWFGAGRGRNLIVIQVESLQEFVVRYRIGGQEVTPSINRRLDNALRFTRVFDQSSQGRTSDGEFVSLASLLPLERGAVAFQYPGNHYVTLPSVLATHGYHTLSAVPFDPDFWNRRFVHPRYGFSRSLFVDDFTPAETIGWGLNDRDFLIQLATTIRTLPRPFAVWGITLSLHHPFADFPDHLKTLDVGRWEYRPFGNYLHAMRFFDEAFDMFLKTLGKMGVLDDTVIAIVGDHDSGLRWEPRLAREIGFPHNRLEWILLDRVPFIVWLPGANAPHGEIGQLAGQTDIPPTLLALMGIDAARLPFVGRNLLNDGDGGPILRPLGNWVDETHLFMGAGANPENQVCYDTRTRRRVELDPCLKVAAEAERAFRISQQVVTYDLQAELAERAAR
jgi:phosphoglycerol transferase MdoB-like AlkP superfamily enzyme